MTTFSVGDRVVCDPTSPKVIADLRDNGWTEQYHKFLHGVESEVVAVYLDGVELRVGDVKASCLIPYKEKIMIHAATKITSPIKSDGGSSSYYDIELPQWLVDLVVKRSESGKIFIKTEELIEVMFNSDFDFANSFKSLVRAYGTMNGAGKEGNTVEYEMNKNIYSSNRIKERAKR